VAWLRGRWRGDARTRLGLIGTIGADRHDAVQPQIVRHVRAVSGIAALVCGMPSKQRNRATRKAAKRCASPQAGNRTGIKKPHRHEQLVLPKEQHMLMRVVDDVLK
jgi:hypothetical protein